MRIIGTLVLLGLSLCGAGMAHCADSCKFVHVIVALADNDHQGIIPVPAFLGNGDDPANNLYWGAAYGVKTYFKRSQDWRLVSSSTAAQTDTILERVVFRHVRVPLYLVADAYRGVRIKEAVIDFLASVAGRQNADSTLIRNLAGQDGRAKPSYDLVAYVGHDGLMDFNLPMDSLKGDSLGKKSIILACMSKQYFAKQIAGLKAEPILWTTGLMAPEAYTLEAAVVAWGEGRSLESIRTRAAEAYDRYQHCGVRAAKRLLVCGF
ncbi:MAG: hypothetical protein IPH75_01520 [bacterium]|nr:hypothetical protein [bacterium]